MSLFNAADQPTLPDWADLWQETLDWQPNSNQAQKFQVLYELILQGNQRLNLTRITAPIDFAEKHLWDSLSGIQPFLSSTSPHSLPSNSALSPQSSALPFSTSHAPRPTPFFIIDIGTGAGFPGIPIAIAQPDWTVTLLDSTRKKIAFVEQLLQALEITNATPVVGRVEEIGHQRQHREQYDLATIRAVAPVSVCAEYALPLLKVGGQAVLYRGQWTDEEAEVLTRAAELLGGKIGAIESFKTPMTQGDRHCITLQKVSQTPPDYPRLTGIPSQKPLGMI